MNLAVNSSESSFTPQHAVQNSTLSFGFSGSGFLLFYFVGVTSVLKHLGVINNGTSFAGASGGSINSAAACTDVTAAQQFASMQAVARTCRPTQGCRGFLDAALGKQLREILPDDAAQRCSGRLYVAVTAAEPKGQPDMPLLLGSEWANKNQLVLALRASSYIPVQSGRAATLKLPWLPAPNAFYDGGFSVNVPCPPGANTCVKVSSRPLAPAIASVSKLVATAPSKIAAKSAVDSAANTAADNSSSNTAANSTAGSSYVKGRDPQMRAALVLLNMMLNNTAINNATDNSTASTSAGSTAPSCTGGTSSSRDGSSYGSSYGKGGNPQLKAVQVVLNMMLNSTAINNATGISTGPYLPLNPLPSPTTPADIYPGLSGPLSVPAATWNSFSLSIPDDAMLQYIFDVGRQDAAAWAVRQGHATAQQGAQALNVTVLAR